MILEFDRPNPVCYSIQINEIRKKKNLMKIKLVLQHTTEMIIKKKMLNKKKKKKKITDKVAVSWMADKKHTYNRIDKYLHMYAVDVVMLTDK